MEICDVFDDAGLPTGRTVTRGTPLPKGEYYLAVQVWIRDESGDYLIQQRAPHLSVGPGMWAATAGQVIAGESSLDGAIREVQEELGLSLSGERFSLFDRLFHEDLMQDIWFVNIPKSTSGDIVINEDVSAVQWASKSTIMRMLADGTFFAYNYLDRLPD